MVFFHYLSSLLYLYYCHKHSKSGKTKIMEKKHTARTLLRDACDHICLCERYGVLPPGHLDTDMLTNIYELLPREQLVVGKYVPDPNVTTEVPPAYTSPYAASARKLSKKSQSKRVKKRSSVLTSPVTKEAQDGTTIGQRLNDSWDTPPDHMVSGGIEDDNEEDESPIQSTPPAKSARRILSPNHGNNPGGGTAPRHVVYNVITTDLVTVYPSCIMFPVHYATPTGAVARHETREAPNLINEVKHGVWTVPTQELRVQTNNGNKLCLYKVGPGAVAFKVVLNAFHSGGLKYTPRDDWNILWAKRVEHREWAMADITQRVNHFPGTWGIGRKDNLHHNLTAMRRVHGSDVYGFAPQTFVLPEDSEWLQADVLAHPGKTYIVKPVASSCGKGISLVMGTTPTIPKGHKSLLVQKYIPNPHLICGRKFDLRMYAVVTSFHPLRLYVFDEGLVRFAAMQYPGSAAKLDNIHMHLTNYSVNKTVEIEKVDGIEIKWDLTDFRSWLAKNHSDAEGVWQAMISQVNDIVVKTFISIEDDVLKQCKKLCKDPNGRGCFEIFGLDLLMDDQYKMYLIEVNIMPSLATQGNLDKAVKNRLLSHLLTLVGVVPHSKGVSESPLHADGKATPLVWDEAMCEAKDLIGKETVQNVLASIGHSDYAKLVLLDTEEEMQRLGGFRRVFPTPDSHDRYGQLFSNTRPLNVLLARWEAAKCLREANGKGKKT